MASGNTSLVLQEQYFGGVFMTKILANTCHSHLENTILSAYSDVKIYFKIIKILWTILSSGNTTFIFIEGS